MGARQLRQRQPQRQWQVQQDQQALKEIRARLAPPAMRGKMLTVRMKKDAPRKHDEPKIKELRKREPEIAAIQVAHAASMSLRRRMEERAASEIEELKAEG